MKRSILVLLALTLSALPAFAGGPLANCTSGNPYRWGAAGANIPWNADQGDLGPLTHAAAVAAVGNAFNAWQAVPTSTVSYLQGADLPVDVTHLNFMPYYNAPAPDGRSAIVFDHTGQIFNILFGAGSGILGFAGPEWGTPATCTITEGLAFLNGPAFTNPIYATDVMVHEFGHYTNLAHTIVNGQIYLGSIGGDATGPSGVPNPYAPPAPLTSDTVETMYPFYYGPGIGTQTLEADDIATVSAIYPDPSFAATTGTIRGFILGANGTTRLSGVNVIARNEASPFVDAVSAISSDWTDSTSQADPVVGTYTLYGLTPGANYRVYIDTIRAGGFSTPPSNPLPGPEEYYNGAAESNGQVTPDPPASFTFVQAGATGVNVIINQPRPGDPLPVGDDGSVQLALPFDFELCGQTFNALFVNANGSLTFGSGSGDFSESIAEFLSLQPRIAPLWDDLNAAAGGTVKYAQTKNDFTVTWDRVPEFGTSPLTNQNSFSVMLSRASSLIDFAYGPLSARDGLVGVSCGSAITSRFETGTDLSSLDGRLNLHNQPAVFELFTTANPVDLASSELPFTGTTTYDDQWAGPNNDLQHARQVSLPLETIPVNHLTEIEPTGGDVDFFRFTATAGTTLVAQTVTGQLDSMIVVADAAGNVIAFNDDQTSTNLLSRVVVTIPADGEYFLGVTAYPDFGFVGAGESGGRYVLRALTVDGTPLPLGDDTSLSTPIGFSFPYQGASFTSVFVNANGNFTFGASNTDFSETVPELLSGPRRVAALWDDLNPAAGGLVLVKRDAASFKVTWMGVPEFLTTNSNNFSITLNATGVVNVDYGAVAALDGIVGVTQGGGAANPGESNLSSSAAWSATGTTYELFTGAADPFDLDLLSLMFNP